ncbi:MAG: CpaE family protein [Eubacterium sp.]
MAKINIVVCSEQTEYKVAIKNKVESTEEFEIIGYSDFNPGAATRLKGFVPDIAAFALDSDSIDEEFLEYVDSLNVSSFGCSSIILTDNITVDLVNSAAQHGIRQVMPLGVGAEEFRKNVAKIVANERRYNQTTTASKRERSRVYSFFSGKGGVGKTTICTNTAVCLASMGKKTILIDLDLQFGDADMALDITPNETIVDLARDSNGISIDNLTSCCTTHSSGLSVLASPTSPELAEYIQSNHTKAIIDVARNYFEYVIIDCGCSLVDPVITALESSDDIFMVNDVNILSLKRAKLCQNVLTQINQQDKIKVVINKNVKKNNIKISDFENLLGLDVFAVISSDLKTVNTSLNNGQPLVSFKPRAPIAKEIKSFAEKLILEREGTLKSVDSKKRRKK